MSFTEKNQEYISHYHSSLTLWYPPQPSTNIYMKSQAKKCILQSTSGSSTLLWFHTQLGILSPLTEAYSKVTVKYSQNKDLYHKSNLIVFQQFPTLKLLSKKKKVLHEICILLSVYFKQKLMNIWKII